MKILYVLNHFLPHQIAGTEVYTWALCKNLQNQFDVQVVIPNYDKCLNEYYYDSIKVLRYDEPSIVDRSLIMGFRIPDGLVAFKDLIEREMPEIIHFHELSGSNGITMHHLQVAKDFGAKVIFTFHLAGYTCRTGTLFYKNEKLCNGIIHKWSCSSCYLHSKNYKRIGYFILPFSIFLQRLGIHTTKLRCRLGTAIGTASIIKKVEDDLKTIFQLCDKIVVLAEWYQKILINNGVNPSKICLIKQGLPSETPQIHPSKESKIMNNIRLLFLGRIIQIKGLHLIIQALHDFPEQAIQLDIYGHSVDYDYESSCRKLANGKKNICWKGTIKQQDVITTMKEYDALCLCSISSEMSPLVIQEAFAAGIPVIASSVYGNTEQVKHNTNGLLFRHNDINSLKEQLERCVREPDLLFHLRENISPVRTFKDVASDHTKLYQSIV